MMLVNIHELADELSTLGDVACDSSVRKILDKYEELSLMVSVEKTERDWTIGISIVGDFDNGGPSSKECRYICCCVQKSRATPSKEENILSSVIPSVSLALLTLCNAIGLLQADSDITANFFLSREENAWCGEIGIVLDGQFKKLYAVPLSLSI